MIQKHNKCKQKNSLEIYIKGAIKQSLYPFFEFYLYSVGLNPKYALEIHKLAQIICIGTFTKFFASPIRCSHKIY